MHQLYREQNLLFKKDIYDKLNFQRAISIDSTDSSLSAREIIRNSLSDSTIDFLLVIIVELDNFL